MKIITNPQKSEWKSILKRPSLEKKELETQIQTILNEVKNKGDVALKTFTKKFDNVHLIEFQVSDQEIQNSGKSLSKELKYAIHQAYKNIRTFHEFQKEEPRKIETMPGVQCWRKSVPIEKVGLYIPGGTAPLFSTVLMLATPAKLAGCKEIILCSPPDKQGNLNPVILYAAKIAGVDKIFKIGGAQAIAALTYGTSSIPAVYKILGPGNQYVTMAKKLVSFENVSIDMPAGPSEVLVFADQTAIPRFVAADLLAQAEHGIDSQVVLVATNKNIIEKTIEEIDVQIRLLPRKKIVAAALKHARFLIINDEETAIDLINEYAPEHLIIVTENADKIAEKITNAGSVFIGNLTPESVGDYASGTNHTLPTNGFAKSFSGVSLDTFVKKITFQKLTSLGLRNIGTIVETLAATEQLEAHKNAVSIRLEKLDDDHES